MLLGDLNAQPTSAELAPLWARYRDAWKLGGIGSGLSYPSHTPASRIDYVALSEGINVRSAEVVNTQASDHRPYAVQLAITTRTSTTAGVGGTVPATLALTLGLPATFAPFTPGIDRTYTASTSATVTSTAGSAALSVSEPGHLRNGAFSLPEPLQVAINPLSFSGPVSNGARHDRLQPAHRRGRRAAHRHLRADADLHAVDDNSITGPLSEPSHPG